MAIRLRYFFPVKRLEKGVMCSKQFSVVIVNQKTI